MTVPQADDKPNPPHQPVSIRAFVESIRDNPGNLDELRRSMRAVGWLEHLPAIQDENGVTLVGNRRLMVAAELGIEPNIKTLAFGEGDAADAERMKLAVASNLGGKGLSKEDRRVTAAYLYELGTNTMVQIAEALGVSFATIQRDLRNDDDFTQASKMVPQGRGRPKGSVIRRGSVADRPPPVAQQPPVWDDETDDEIPNVLAACRKLGYLQGHLERAEAVLKEIAAIDRSELEETDFGWNLGEELQDKVSPTLNRIRNLMQETIEACKAERSNDD